MCNLIQASITLWEDKLETIIENNRKMFSNEPKTLIIGSAMMCSKTIFSMNPYDHLESETNIEDEKRKFPVDNKGCLCDHGGLHPTIAIR